MKETTRRIMKEVMSNALAVTFNFMGHGTKHAFSSLLLFSVVKGKLIWQAYCVRFSLQLLLVCHLKVFSLSSAALVTNR